MAATRRPISASSIILLTGLLIPVIGLLCFMRRGPTAGDQGWMGVDATSRSLSETTPSWPRRLQQQPTTEVVAVKLYLALLYLDDDVAPQLEPSITDPSSNAVGSHFCQSVNQQVCFPKPLLKVDC